MRFACSQSTSAARSIRTSSRCPTEQKLHKPLRWRGVLPRRAIFLSAPRPAFWRRGRLRRLWRWIAPRARLRGLRLYNMPARILHQSFDAFGDRRMRGEDRVEIGGVILDEHL